MSPDFFATAGSPEDSAISNPPVAAHARNLPFISMLPDVVRLPGLSWLDLWRNPRPNPATLGPFFLGSRSRRRRLVVYQKFDEGGRSRQSGLFDQGTSMRRARWLQSRLLLISAFP